MVVVPHCWGDKVMDDIDQHTWVLCHDKSTRASLTRRMALGKGTSVVIQLHPLEPKKVTEVLYAVTWSSFGHGVDAYRLSIMAVFIQQVCDITFIGPDALTQPLRQKLCSNLSHW